MANESRRRITPAMELDNKKSHRQSRAPWISGAAKANNPYAAANTSAISGDNQSLQVPSNPHGISNTSRKNTRRLSIHASAAAHSLGRSSSQNAPFDATSLPPVPRLPNHSNKPDGEDQKDEFMNIEKKIFQDLANGTAAEVDDYYNLLIKQKALITRDIKTNINQNQKNILQLTNDLKETQDELLQLRITTKDLYEVLDHFKESAQRRLDVELEIPSQQSQNQPKLQAQKRKDRSSILVLEKMWQSELQSLFKHVEGASKYIQPLPGRHVLAESGRWQEINIGTWKPIKPAHLFVLNDLLLMATKKSSQDGGGSKSRLHAVQCWPLSQVLLEEIQAPNQKAEDAKSYIINIKSKSLSYVYQTDRYDHYLKIMEAYNKGKNEILQQERLLNAGKAIIDSADANDEKKQLRESFRNSGIIEGSVIDDGGKRLSGSIRNSTDGVLQDISVRVHSRNRSHDFGAKKLVTADKGHFFNNLKNLEDKLDDVDVEIAHNQYSQAVGLIAYIENKLKSIESAINGNNNSKQDNSSEEVQLLIDVIKLKIGNRKVKVQHGLIFDLQYNISKLTEDEIESIIVFFDSFNQLEKGISSYLNAMSNHLSSTVTRMIVGVQGSTKIDVVNYLSNLVVINVSFIRRAVLVYNRKISNILKRNQDRTVDSSGLINWCVDEITKLVQQIKKLLYGTLLTASGTNPETDQPILVVKDEKLFNELIEVVVPQLDELKEVGVNVDYLFEDILRLQTK
jgi:hypothetical protein